MIYLVLSILLTIAVMIGGIFLLQLSERLTEWDFFTALAGVCSIVISFLLLIITICVGWGWKAAAVKVAIINREYHTEYTQEEIFFASDIIDTIKQLDRERIEINGNLFQDKK